MFCRDKMVTQVDFWPLVVCSWYWPLTFWLQNVIGYFFPQIQQSFKCTEISLSGLWNTLSVTSYITVWGQPSGQSGRSGGISLLLLEIRVKLTQCGITVLRTLTLSTHFIWELIGPPDGACSPSFQVSPTNKRTLTYIDWRTDGRKTWKRDAFITYGERRHKYTLHLNSAYLCV